MSQQGFLMKRSGGKFTGSSYGNRKNKLDRRWFRIREGALYYYKQGLELGPSVGEDGGIFDLSREIAFNMSLIYQGAGNMHLARMYTEKYIVV